MPNDPPATIPGPEMRLKKAIHLRRPYRVVGEGE